MTSWIALFRGINVGGKNKLPMAALRSTLESIGCQTVRTYIQSGNVVFTCESTSKPKLARRIAHAVDETFGFLPQVMLLTPDEFRVAVTNNPFPDAAAFPKTLHFFFLSATPDDPDLASIADLASETERFELIGDVFYLHTPDGFGTSKLAKGVERKLGVATTARNHSTIEKLASLLDSE
ncbi:DUF1697 domain-containing protein [Rhodopirellula europaea]|jgi:uncharacterized protein (DUF1697 family)|uniref:Protein containing DUF1697 n=1 Tax=Rhodopirellula europaea SH398 TaxID=1263868 RepID=M5S6D8_9BACT|nr:DUF1697 domain-containing protein [Rhodopirellula europaea]EMI23217.1 protein containing DUF1697 [Rhodopirellula europaea SH398]